LRRIRSLAPRERVSPERAINEMLRAMPNDNLSAEEIDLLEIARNVVNAADGHSLVGSIVHYTGECRAVALSRIMKLASKSDGWERYTRVIRGAMVEIRHALNIDARH
jgi:hypothetical protein